MTKVETREGRRVRIGGINVRWVGKNPHHTENGNEWSSGPPTNEVCGAIKDGNWHNKRKQKKVWYFLPLWHLCICIHDYTHPSSTMSNLARFSLMRCHACHPSPSLESYSCFHATHSKQKLCNLSLLLLCKVAAAALFPTFPTFNKKLSTRSSCRNFPVFIISTWRKNAWNVNILHVLIRRVGIRDTPTLYLDRARRSEQNFVQSQERTQKRRERDNERRTKSEKNLVCRIFLEASTTTTTI